MGAVRNFVYQNFNSGLLPQDHPLRREICENMASTSGLFLALEPQVFVSKVRCRVFRNWKAAEDYYSNTLREAKFSLVGEGQPEPEIEDAEHLGFMAEGCVMVAPGAKGSFPSSTDDATRPKNIIALSNPHTRTTGFQGTRMYMADLRDRRGAYVYLYYTVTTGFGVELSDSERKRPIPVPSTSLCEPFREAIELGLSQGRNAIGIWQDLVSESGFNGGYQTVKRFVRKLRGNQPPQPRAVIITAPGEESQVDYGTGPMVRPHQYTVDVESSG
jgi:hypothetical protein